MTIFQKFLNFLNRIFIRRYLIIDGQRVPLSKAKKLPMFEIAVSPKIPLRELMRRRYDMTESEIEEMVKRFEKRRVL